MSGYYYLVATLPDLQLEVQPPLDASEFLRMCDGNVKPKDLKMISWVFDHGPEDPVPKQRALRAWDEFDKSLVYIMAQQRAERSGRAVTDAYEHSYGRYYTIMDTVKRALDDKSPLAAERILDAARFACADGLEAGHPFDTTKLLMYALKLKIVSREQRFDFELGDEEFKRLLSNIKTSIKSY